MNRRLAASLAATALLLASCSASGGDGTDGSSTSSTTTASAAVSGAAGSESEQAILAANGLDGLSTEEIVTTMDQDPAARPLALSASVRPDEVVVNDGTTEFSLPLEGDEFYLSVAPYESQTHECFYHALGGCQGELTDTPVHVTITTDDGDVLVDEDATTYANGFVGFWLPRDTTGTVEMTVDGLTGSAPFDTSEEGATCMTTLQVS